MSKFIKHAQEVFDIEIEGLKYLRDNLDREKFNELIEMSKKTLDNGGKLILTGIGKSGYIGQKISATLSSVGSPSIFMHPVEALHGDLGIVQENDLLIAISYSGETDELLAIITPAKRLGLHIVAITGCSDSRLANLCDLTIDMNVPKEACPFNLAPTTTTTALLVLGDALAMVLLEERGFTKRKYGSLHPGGAIGRAVTMRISDIMRPKEKLAISTANKTVKECLYEMTRVRCGATIVVNENSELLGVFTDGDFRRHAESDITVLDKKISEVMTENPISVNANILAVEALKLIENKHINDIVAIDDESKVIGLVDIQDLPGLKLM
ncbi:KpsF/GutQ family sugar-phosphate isomerase [Lentisphaerota bacterium WC36G]|nr:KpsF/GutQ family sugar-phosphate isomerase [Lentisphaerae bacterium WC36]